MSVIFTYLLTCTSYSFSWHHHLHHPSAPIKSRIKTFWYGLTGYFPFSALTLLVGRQVIQPVKI